MHRFEYHAPASLAEAIALLDRYGDWARVIAGGTDLLTALKERWETPGLCHRPRRDPGPGRASRYDEGAG